MKNEEIISPETTTVLKVAVTLIGALLLLTASLFVVGPGERGVKYTATGGVADKVYEEGWHFKVPILESTDSFDVRVQKYRKETSAASNDLQEVTTTLALNYRVNPEAVDDLYRETGPNYVERVIDPAIEETLKAVTARYEAQALIQNRSSVKQDIRDELLTRLEPYDLVVEDVSIENFKFTPEFSDAIEQKEIARQEALKEQNLLEAVKARADQERARAEGQADAIRIVNEELSNSPEYVDWLTIDKWNGETQTIVPLAQGGATPLIDVSNRSD